METDPDGDRLIAAKYVQLLTEPTEEYEKVINLFWHDDHFSTVKCLSRLLSSQVSGNGKSEHFCPYCLNHFGTEQLMNSHTKDCCERGRQRTIFPVAVGDTKENGKKQEEKPIITFKNHKHTTDVPFSIQADTECMIMDIPDKHWENKKVGQGTRKRFRKVHVPYMAGFVITSNMKIEGFEPTMVIIRKKDDDHDLMKEFCKAMSEAVAKLYDKHFKSKVPINMSPKDERDYNSSERCYLCSRLFSPDSGSIYWKVRDHCHFTGKYRGAAHSICNLRASKPDFIPALFHNLEGYDEHLFLPSLATNGENVTSIPLSEEKHKSISKEILRINVPGKKDGKTKAFNLRFIDSANFLQSSLQKLAENLPKDGFNYLEKFVGKDPILKQKGVFPYEYIDSMERLNETCLPPKEKFFSSLTNEGISDEDYTRAHEVWNRFECKTLWDYSEVYLKTDITILTDVFEDFRKMAKETYGLDPLWYYTAPGLSLDAALKFTRVELDQITDPDMSLMVEKGIRGGICMAVTRYAKANNPHLKDYDPNKEKSYFRYWDANNLYGSAMSRPLPVQNFKWMTEDQFEKWRDYPCFLEVDLEYPDSLHSLHNDYPLAPERMKIGKVDKLICNLNDKERYVVHHKTLKFYLKLGLKLKKIHRGIEFDEEDWLKPYIAKNTEERKKVGSKSEKNFFKLMNNAVFGKTMENVRNRVDVRMATSKKQINNLARKTNYQSFNIISENLTSVRMKRSVAMLDKPIYLGATILDLSKVEIYDFWYNYAKPTWDDKVRLVMTDTDSLFVHIRTDDVDADILKKGDHLKYFDHSNYDEDHPMYFSDNKMKLGFMKNETGGEEISDACAIRAKMYAFRMSDGSEKKNLNLNLLIKYRLCNHKG